MNGVRQETRHGCGGLRIVRSWCRVNKGVTSHTGNLGLPGRQSEDKGVKSESPDKNESGSLLGRMSSFWCLREI